MLGSDRPRANGDRAGLMRISTSLSEPGVVIRSEVSAAVEIEVLEVRRSRMGSFCWYEGLFSWCYGWNCGILVAAGLFGNC